MSWNKTLACLACVFLAITAPLQAQSLARQLVPRDNSPGRAGSQTLDQVLASDATLHDVTFVDAQHGWAVGDRGVVLVTDDGGAHWHAQRSGVDCPLLSVSFADTKRGWIVGGQATPLAHRTTGVVLRTIDGGASWKALDSPTLPRLTFVQFFDAAHGVAAGYGSSFYPSGLFTTTDGGRSWQPLAGSTRTTWLAGSFVAPDTGLLAGTNGSRGLVFDRRLKTPAMATTDLREAQAISAVSNTEAWMVGRDGLVLRTTDSGTTWQPPAASPLTFEPAVNRAWQWNTVATQGSHVWLAGMPGSAIAHSSDSGATWTLQTTGQSVPVKKLKFVDKQRGWAVGVLGTILATDDAGRTWRTQRGGGRAAVMMLTGAPELAPPELAARYAAGDGYRMAITSLFHASATNESIDDQHRLAEAVVDVGGEYQPPLWAYAVPPPGHHSTAADLLAELNRQSDGKATERLLARLELAIRTWRPEVIIAPHARNEKSQAASDLVEQLARVAAQRAADAQRHPQLAAVGLPPWQVKRSIGLLSAGQRGTLRLATDNFVPSLGGSAAQKARGARGLLYSRYTVAPPLIEMELVQQQAGMAASARDPFAGLNLSHGSEARRVAVTANPADLDRLRKLSQKRAQLVRLMDYGEGSPVWSAQVVQLTAGLEADTGGELLYQLAEGYRTTGRQAMAADTMYLLAKRYPEHPLTEQALRWLVQYYASGEVANAADRRQAKAMRTRPLANVPAEAKPELPENQGGGTSDLDADGRLKRASALGEYLSKARPALYTEPSLRFPLSVAARKLGFDTTADRYFMVLAKQDADADWTSAARAETWLAKPNELPPDKPVAACKAIAGPPKLDARLDEPFWQKANPLRIATDRDDTTAATAWLARDEKFLYVAIKAPRLASENYTEVEGPRQRDADLEMFDRVTLAIDIDRDYSSAYQLTVDCRGWTHDACWGNSNWNPKWYVAHQLSERDWTIEMAIPWSEIAEEGPAVLDAWCLQVTRKTSRGQSVSWTGTVGGSPESFGLILFR